MRSCLLILSALGTLIIQPTASAQNTVPSNRPAGSAAALPMPTESTIPSTASATGTTVGRDAKLTPGDQVSITIEEDREPGTKTIVTDQGTIDLNGLGEVRVAGLSAPEAESVVGRHLMKDFYHKATVRMTIVQKAVGAIRPAKTVLAGKVGRPGPQYFTAAAPLKLSEAVIQAGPTLYSDLRKVKLTRKGQTTVHDVRAMTKDGRTELDLVLQDGDQIYVDPVGIRFGSD